MILPSAATATGVFLARQFILGIPDELLEAAKLDGAGSFRVFRSIVLPLCRPLIAVLVVLIAMATWNDFAWPLIALKEDFLFTLPIGLLYLQGQTTPDFTQIMALSLIAVRADDRAVPRHAAVLRAGHRPLAASADGRTPSRSGDRAGGGGISVSVQGQACAPAVGEDAVGGLALAVQRDDAVVPADAAVHDARLPRRRRR